MEGGFSDLILKEFEMNPWTIYTSYHVDRCTFIESGCNPHRKDKIEDQQESTTVRVQLTFEDILTVI